MTRGWPGFTQKQLNTMARTNMPGFRKNEKQNVLLPESAEAIRMVHVQRDAYKTQQRLEDRVVQLEAKLEAILKMVDSK